MGVTFRRSVKWPDNDLLLPPDYFGVTVPPGLGSMDVRAANFVDMNKMMQLAKGTSTANMGGGLGVAEGYTDKDLKVRFSNPAAQWRRTPGPGAKDANHGPLQYQFTGGEVLIDLLLGLYVIESDEPTDDDLSVKIFALVYRHELLHVLDEIDILNNWMTSRLNTEPTVQKYLVQGEPYTYGTQTMLAAQIDQDFRTFITNQIQVAIFNLWGTESNRRERLRDAPAEYKIVSDAVNALRAQQINRPHH